MFSPSKGKYPGLVAGENKLTQVNKMENVFIATLSRTVGILGAFCLSAGLCNDSLRSQRAGNFLNFNKATPSAKPHEAI